MSSATASPPTGQGKSRLPLLRARSSFWGNRELMAPGTGLGGCASHTQPGLGESFFCCGCMHIASSPPGGTSTVYNTRGQKVLLGVFQGEGSWGSVFSLHVCIHPMLPKHLAENQSWPFSAVRDNINRCMACGSRGPEGLYRLCSLL